jgi:hypothetical protein
MPHPAHSPGRRTWTWRAVARAHWECGIVLLGYLALRVPLLTARGLASDEVFTVHEMAVWPLQRLLDSYYVVVLQSLCLSAWTWDGALTHEAWLRLLPVLQGVAGLLGVYVLLRRYSGRVAALLAMLVYSCAQFQIAYTLYLRFYSLQMSLIIWLIYAWLRWVEWPSWRWLAWVAGLGALACMAHPYSALVLMVLGAHFVLTAWIEWPVWLRPRWAWWHWCGVVLAGALVAVLMLVTFDQRAALLARDPFGTGVRWVQTGGWLPDTWRALQALVRTQLLHGTVIAPVFSFGLCGVALTITVAQRVRRRAMPLVELLLVLYAVLPALLLAHLQSTHTFFIRYLAFWFPAWVLIIGQLGAVIEWPLQRRRGVVLALELVLIGLAFGLASPRAALSPDDEQNRAVVNWITARAGTNRIVLITTPAMFNKHEVIPEYLFDVRQCAGEWHCDALTIARRGISRIAMPPACVVWLRAFGGLTIGADMTGLRTGFYTVAMCTTVLSNWHDVWTATQRVMPDLTPVPADAPPTLLVDAGTAAAHPYLWNGWSHDEQWAPDLTCVWGTGTDLWLRLPGLAASNYWLVLRAKALKPTVTTVSFGGQQLAPVCVSTDWSTSMTPLPRVAVTAAANAILRLQPNRCAAPGRVAPRVHETRSLSICLDWLRLVPVTAFPTGHSVYAAQYLPTPLPALRAAAPQTWQVQLRNCGTRVWPGTTANPVRLGLRWLTAAGAEVASQRVWLPHDVYPGQTVTLVCTLTPPAQSGAYTLQLDAVHENVTWFAAHCPPWQTNVMVAPP